ncbi:MAG TPA: PQQ-dependent sugar dehydrogenase [Dehalococcoidia bacterium]|nr:PQQ-dependent sugar dehydrogenase [Dehalococcoidia bacterium]
MTRYWTLSLVLIASLLCGACGDDGDSSSPPASQAPVPTTGASPAASGQTGSPATADAGGALPQVRLQRVYANLSFRQMTGMYQAPDGRMFVTEQPGRVLAFDSRAAAPTTSVFLDITERVDASSNEMGLLGFAFAPDFAQSGIVYASYTAGNPRRSVISRFRSNQAHTSGDPASEEVLLQVDQPFVNHNGGQILFGPDGFLYIGLGDGGSARDPQGNGQNRRVLLGKLLRIDVGGRSGNLAYRIPADNPFVGQGATTREEIWALGLRNPWRFSFDSRTGALWLADVGQNTKEEIDIIEKGGNYGWVVMEGFDCLGGGTNCDRTGFIPPVFEYPTGRAGNCSVTGGFVYRGEAIAGLRGAYVYGDYCSGRVWALRYDGAKVIQQAELADGNIMISSFAVDASGEIYALQHAGSGGIFKLVP